MAEVAARGPSAGADAQGHLTGQGHLSGETGVSNIYNLIVHDNGIGFPKDLDFNATDTLGMQLVNILTKQLNGSIRMDREAGTTFTINFIERKIRNTGRLIMADKTNIQQTQSREQD